MNEFKRWSELSPLEQAACTFSDFFKESYGFRPRHIDTSGWSLEDFDREFEVLARVCKENEVMRAAEEAAAVVRFEARIVDLIACGAKDRTTAIRWIAEAEDCGSDMSYLCYCLGLPYQYLLEVA
jgi:hypothetical protein